MQKLIERILRKQLNSFSKSIICSAKERGVINNDQLHALAGAIDRRLWPERYR